jgi:hypothetical protein
LLRPKSVMTTFPKPHNIVRNRGKDNGDRGEDKDLGQITGCFRVSDRDR